MFHPAQRFRQEARSIAALNHPYICQLHDIGRDYLVLEYVEGKSLSSPLPERSSVINVFMSAVYFMEGRDPLPWWSFTDERKMHIINNQRG